MAIFYEANTLDNCLIKAYSIIDIIDGSLAKTPMEVAWLVVIYHTCWELWNQHNDQIYNHKHPTFSIRAMIELAKEHMATVAWYSMS